MRSAMCAGRGNAVLSRCCRVCEQAGAVGRALRILRRQWLEGGCVATSNELLEAWKDMREC